MDVTQLLEHVVTGHTARLGACGERIEHGPADDYKNQIKGLHCTYSFWLDLQAPYDEAVYRRRVGPRVLHGADVEVRGQILDRDDGVCGDGDGLAVNDGEPCSVLHVRVGRSAFPVVLGAAVPLRDCVDELIEVVELRVPAPVVAESTGFMLVGLAKRCEARQ